MTAGGISQNSRRVAKNTALLYLRMLLLMFIGLFTSRIVLQCLGVEDYGTYNVVYSIVMMFTVISNSVSGAISRFLAYEIGKGDPQRIKKVFSGAIFIQTACGILLVILGETLGVWYLQHHTELPVGREGAAMWVLQCSIVLLLIQLYSIPFNCTIIAHEDMKAFAWISILEGVLKLAVAFCLYLVPSDKLVAYALMMTAVALTVRGTYAFYCRRHYEETRGKLVFDSKLIRPMLSMSGWSATAYGIGVFNTQGINLLSNSVFGVGINASRGIASQVENIVRQFVNNFLTALTPQITKSWAKGDRDYCFALVRKGCKFSFLIVLLFAVPFALESEYILQLWLGNVPPDAAVFTKLVIICVMADTMANSLAQLIVAEGRVALYYILTSVISLFTFAGSWFTFRQGLPAYSAYVIAIAVYALMLLMRLVLCRKLTGFPIREFVREAVLPLALVCALSYAAARGTFLLFDGAGIARLIAVTAASTLIIAVVSYFIAFTPGEREFVKGTLWKKR